MTTDLVTNPQHWRDRAESSEAFMSRMTAGRVWGLDSGDWFMLLGGIAVVGLLALLV